MAWPFTGSRVLKRDVLLAMTTRIVYPIGRDIGSEVWEVVAQDLFEDLLLC